MSDVENIFAVLCVSLLALQPLKNLQFFYINFCCFSNRNVSFFAMNDAMASTPHRRATFDS